MSSITRRRLLRAGSLAAASGLAGCSALGLDGKSHPRLGQVMVYNKDEKPHTLHLDVEFDGEIVKRESYDLPGREDSTIYPAYVEPTWPCEPAPFAIRIRAGGPPGPVECDGAEKGCAKFESQPGDYYMRCFKPGVGSPTQSESGEAFIDGTMNDCRDWDHNPCSPPSDSPS